MLSTMPDEQVHNDMPGTIVGAVTEVGAVHGDMYVHSSPAPATEPPIDRADRIACEMDDIETETFVLGTIVDRPNESRRV